MHSELLNLMLPGSGVRINLRRGAWRMYTSKLTTLEFGTDDAQVRSSAQSRGTLKCLQRRVTQLSKASTMDLTRASVDAYRINGHGKDPRQLHSGRHQLGLVGSYCNL